MNIFTTVKYCCILHGRVENIPGSLGFLQNRKMVALNETKNAASILSSNGASEIYATNAKKISFFHSCWISSS